MSVDLELGPLQAHGGRPRLAHLLVSDHCNHSCGHCYQVHGQKGELSLAELEGVLDELARAGVLFVSFSGGEATLRPDLPELLRAARARGFAIILQTNGYELSEELLDEIARVGVWRVRISVYSDVAAEHDRVTRVPGSFESTTATMKKLRERGVIITMVTPLTSACTASAERLEALARSLDCTLETSSALTAREDGSDAPFELRPDAAQMEEYFRAEQAGAAAPVVARGERLEQHPCGACSRITIHSDGSVRPCTHLPVELDHVRQNGPGAIARLGQNDAFQRIAAIRWRDLHGCRDCALVQWCSRCHGSAAWEHGDAFGPQASACARALARYEAHVGRCERAASAAPPRAPDMGPFERLESGALRQIPDRLTPADLEMRARYSWVQPSRSEILGMAGLVPAARLVRTRDEPEPRWYSQVEKEAL